jgi:hypothetical protein
MAESLAACSKSKRKSASRLPSSGPWQFKQFSDRIGRMSSLKRTPSLANIGDEAIAPNEEIRATDKMNDCNRNPTCWQRLNRMVTLIEGCRPAVRFMVGSAPARPCH